MENILEKSHCFWKGRSAADSSVWKELKWMLGKGTVRAEAQQCMHIPSCCWEQLCDSPPATAFQSSPSVELSFQILFWPCSFFCHSVRASRDCDDGYYELPDSSCCHDAVLMPSLMPIWHCIEPASELIAYYQIAYISSAEGERKALPQYSGR